MGGPQDGGGGILKERGGVLWWGFLWRWSHRWGPMGGGGLSAGGPHVVGRIMEGRGAMGGGPIEGRL